MINLLVFQFLPHVKFSSAHLVAGSLAAASGINPFEDGHLLWCHLVGLGELWLW